MAEGVGGHVSVPSVEQVRLTEQEQALFNLVNFDERTLANRPPDDPDAMFAASAELMKRLVERNAIPAVRLRYFTDPGFNIGGHGKSREDVFVRNRTSGDAILAHPHFIKHLRYFVLGPDLPQNAIAGFRQILISDVGTSGMLLDQLCKFTRAESRALSSPSRYDVHEEFFKLAMECGLDTYFATSVRKAAQSAH